MYLYFILTHLLSIKTNDINESRMTNYKKKLVKLLSHLDSIYQVSLQSPIHSCTCALALQVH